MAPRPDDAPPGTRSPRQGARPPSGSRRAAVLATLIALFAGVSGVTAQVEVAVFEGLDINTRVGWAVDLSGTTAVSGAPGTHDNSEGGVFVYRRSGGDWSADQQLLGSTSDSLDWFGHAVAVDGDVLVAGDWGESDGLPNQPGYQRGAAYVFRRPDGASPFAEEARLQPADLLDHDRFGMAVALDGDRLAVAARGADDAADEAGAVYVFRHDGNSWNQEARLTRPGAEAHDRFGFALALDGDTLVIGADSADAAAVDGGAAHVYRHDGANWQAEAVLTAAGAARDERFGWCLSLQGDLLAVGVPRRDVGAAINAGAVEVWRRSGSSWAFEAELTDAAPTGFDNLGSAVSVDAERVLVGVPLHDDDGPQAGRALLFSNVGAGSWAASATLDGSLVDLSDHYGFAVALQGPVALVGAPLSRNGALALGRVHLHEGLPGATP